MIALGGVTEEAFAHHLTLTGELFTSRFSSFQYHIDHFAPIVGEFAINSRPEGFPPDDIRDEWIGVILPIRIEPQPGLVIINSREAIQALSDENRTTAVGWWEDYYARMAEEKMPMIDPEDYPAYLSNICFLGFVASDGEIVRR